MSDLAPEAAAATEATAATAATGTGRVPGRPPMVTTASITTFGHLAWIGWVWLAFGVVVIGVVVGYGVFGDNQMHDSLWQNFAAGWQRWILLAAGFATTRTFAPMLVGNGVTRAQMSSSVIVAMVVLAVAGGLFITAGYLVEGVVFSSNDWNHVLDGGGRTLGGRMIAGLGVRYALGLAASFVSGWLIGIGFYRFGPDGGIPLIVPCVIPIVLVELLLLDGDAGLGIGPLQDVSGPPLAVGAPAAVLVVALAAVVATRYNRRLELQEA